MPTLRKDRGNEWLARVVVDGRQVASLTFPPGRKKGPEWTAAKSWEVKTKQDIEALVSKGHTLLDALEALGVKPGQQLLAEVQREKKIPMGLERLLAWSESYLTHVERTMSESMYQEKNTQLEAFLAFCMREKVDSPEAVSKPLAYQFLAGIYEAKEQEAQDRLAGRVSDEQRRKGGKIGKPGSVANKYRKNILAAWNWGIDYVTGFPQGKSPFALVKEWPVEEEERYVPPEEDVIKVLNLAKGQDLVMLLVFYYTGARAGEVFRLTWSKDVRLDTSKIRLQDRKIRGGKKRTRWNDMDPELVKALAWWREVRPCEVDNVFMQTHCHSALGLPFKHRSKFCETLCKRAGVKPFVFYSIRHVSAHISFKEGGISAAKSQLGHYHGSTTDKYLREMGLFTDQSAIQRDLSRGRIGLAGANLIEDLMADEGQPDGELLQKRIKPHEVRTHEAFCNQDHVTNVIQ